VKDKQLEHIPCIWNNSNINVCKQCKCFLLEGGLSNAIKETLAMGGRAFGLFLKSQRTWNSKPLEDADAEIFKTALKVYHPSCPCSSNLFLLFLITVLVKKLTYIATFNF